MKIEISLDEFEDILKGRYKNIREILRPDFFNDSNEHFRIGEKAGKEKVYQYLLSVGYPVDCLHGRPKWDCKECLK